MSNNSGDKVVEYLYSTFVNIKMNYYNTITSNSYDCNTEYSMEYNMFPNSPCVFQGNTVENFNNETRNRFVYVNQNFITGNPPANSTVLINPNFKPSVHINPNFRKPVKPSIHVNPNILKLSNTNSVIKSAAEDSINSELINKEIKKPALVATRTKLVRVVGPQKCENSRKIERRMSVHTKYKIIHGHDKPKETPKLKENYLKNKYKIDKNITSTKKLFRKRNITIINNNSLNKITSAKHTKIGNPRYISINGTLYKKTPNILKKADLVKIASGRTNINKSKILLIRGELYKLDHHQKRLKMLSVISCTSPKLRRKSVEGLKQKILNKIPKLNKNKYKLKLSGKKMFNTVLVSKMKKCNLPCPTYRRFGKCKANEMGKCIRVHNPDQIMLCTKFLQGACFNSKCSLSHKVSAEKVPTCKYFLEGRCIKEDCVYLHVKISAKADICKAFLEGYCKEAKECIKRHQFLCPDYEKTGACPRKRCQYPHGDVVRNTKYIKKVAKRIIKKKVADKPVKVDTDNLEGDEQPDKNVRYYVDNLERNANNNDNRIERSSANENLESKTQPNRTIKEAKLSKRCQLGVLPSYIPFGEIDSSHHVTT